MAGGEYIKKGAGLACILSKKTVIPMNFIPDSALLLFEAVAKEGSCESYAFAKIIS